MAAVYWPFGPCGCTHSNELCDVIKDAGAIDEKAFSSFQCASIQSAHPMAAARVSLGKFAIRSQCEAIVVKSWTGQLPGFGALFRDWKASTRLSSCVLDLYLSTSLARPRLKTRGHTAVLGQTEAT